MYKLIAIDMDGTLLREDKTVSKGTVNAINMARKKGIKIVLATGRPIEGVNAYLKELDLISREDYVLTFNGALVQNTFTEEIVARNTIKGKDYKRLYDISKKVGVNIHAFSNLGCITPKMSKYTEVEGTINKIPVRVLPVELVGDQEDIMKVMMIDEPEVLDKAIEKLPKEIYEDYTVLRSTPYFLEFLSKKSNKGEGVKALADFLNIKQEEVICIGDAGNDLHMIKYAGLGVAMGNAFEEVKEIADYITKNNEDDGVAHVINKFALAI